MASTTNKTLDKPANGVDVDTWDQPVNANSDIIDAAFGNTTNINVVAATGTIVLTLTQYRPSRIILSGLLTANVNYQFPATIGWNGTVFNNTTGAFSVTFSSAGAGTSIVIPQGASVGVSCDATNVYFTNNAASGSNTQIQYNNSNVLGASSKLTWTDGSGALGITGKIQLNGATSGNVVIQPAATSDNTVYTWPGTNGAASTILTNDGTGILSWATASGAVTTFSAGTTGFTPSSPTAGAVVLAGTLVPANGGTGLTTFGAANRALYSTAAGTLTAATLPVAAGGTGATTLTGVVIGNGTSAFTVKTNPSGAFVGDTDSQTLTNKTLTSPVITGGTVDRATSIAASGTIGTTSLGYRGIPQNSQAGTYTLVLSDNGQHVFAGGTVTIPANASVAFPVGATVVFINSSGSVTQTINITSDTLVLAGTGSTGSRTLAINGIATVVKVRTTAWIISGNVS